MKQVSVRFLPSSATVEVPLGTTLLEAAFRAGLYLNSLCGGQGSCGKCLVRLMDGTEVRACGTRVHEPLTVQVKEGALNDNLEKTARLVEKVSYPHEPLVYQAALELPPPREDENRADLQRLLGTLKSGKTSYSLHPRALRDLPGVLRRGEWSVTATLFDHQAEQEIIRVDEGLSRQAPIGVALDIGTTTLAALLVRLSDGAVLSGKACYNPQISFGDDVISRIIYASKKNGLDTLRKAILERINSLITVMAAEQSIRPADITACLYTGNTTMMHLFYGIDPSQIRRDPYVPATQSYPPLPAGEAGLIIAEEGYALGLPGISSFVGSDIVAGILACGMAESDRVTILMDIGTNGEVVLGCREWMVCCSCSAGPAFEGGGITHGMRATEGAIDRVTFTGGERGFALHTIGGSPPRGLCGSGLIELIGGLFRHGIIDRSGKFILPPAGSWIKKNDEGAFLVLAEPHESGTGEELTLSEADIANTIRAKGALYAGTEFLLGRMGLTFDDVAAFYIAGGFGTSLDIDQAVFIGLLPDMPQEKFEFIGNSSLAGAKMALLSKEAREKAAHISRCITNFELSREAAFMNDYTSTLFLPHTDLGRFPRVEAFLQERKP